MVGRAPEGGGGGMYALIVAIVHGIELRSVLWPYRWTLIAMESHDTLVSVSSDEKYGRFGPWYIVAS